jgi:multidrug transporter EmrE-like cation transporter
MNSPNTKAFLALLAVYFVFEIGGNILVKRWADDSSRRVELATGLLLYFLCGVLWAISLRYESFTKASVIYILVAMLTDVAVGLYWFQETVNRVNVAGILLGLASIVLVQWR